MVAECTPPGAIEGDFITGAPIGNRGGYRVRVEDALGALDTKSEEAANWFRRNIPEWITYLTFGPEEARIAS